MIVQTDLIITFFICGLGMVYAVYAALLATLKMRRPGAPLRENKKWLRHMLGFALLFTILFSFPLGMYVLPIHESTLGFVLYWWAVLTGVIALFLIPALDLHEDLQKRIAKRQQTPHVVLQMVDEEEDSDVPPPESPEDPPVSPPTLH